MGSEIVLMNFSHSVASKSSDLSCTSNQPFTHALVIQKISVHWVLQLFQMFTHFPCNIKKKKTLFVNITTNLISKVFRYWDTFKLTETYTSFKILIFMWKVEFYHGQLFSL